MSSYIVRNFLTCRSYGPFGTYQEAVRWARARRRPQDWDVVELRGPELVDE